MKSIMFITILILLWLCQPLMSGEADTKKNELLIFEGHTHIGLSIEGERINGSDYKYYSDRDVNAIFFTLPVDRSKTSDLLKRIESEISKIKDLSKKSKSIKLAINAKDYHKNFAEKRNSIGLSIEYFYGIFNNNQNTIKKYSEMGIRMICLINTSDDRLFILKNKKEVLSDFGKKIIENMNKFGILIDITHLRDEQRYQVIKHSKSPVIASHSNARGPSPSNFNVSDKVIKALKENGGLFLVSFDKNGLFPDKKNVGIGAIKFVQHINYLKKMLGINRIGIGTDLQAAGKYVAADLRGKDSFKKIVMELKNNHYSIDEIRKIMSGNLIKFLANQER